MLRVYFTSINIRIPKVFFYRKKLIITFVHDKIHYYVNLFIFHSFRVFEVYTFIFENSSHKHYFLDIKFIMFLLY